jgi:PhnB protein
VKITPHIVVRDAERAVDWYKRALGAEERERIPLPGGKLMSVELAFGESTVMLADEFPEAGVLSPLSVGGTSVVLNISTDDVDSLWQRALDAGAEVLHPLQDAFWGERHGQITDPYGHRWGLAQHIRDVPHDEVVRAAAEAFGP